MHEGVCMEAIHYGGKHIVIIDVYEKHIKTEIKIVKSLIGEKNSPRVTFPKNYISKCCAAYFVRMGYFFRY